ncbi:MAG: glutamate-cysteine ligase family protein [Euzebya sp.]
MGLVDLTTRLTRPGQVADHLAASYVRSDPSAPLQGKVGLEAETFVVHACDQRRSDLSELVAALQTVAGLERTGDDSRPGWSCVEGLLTEEPGGQLELITRPEDSLALALDQLDALAGRLEGPLEAAGLVMAGTGLDAWHDAEDLDIQIDLPRYQAMATYFQRRGTNGRALMCASASVQINLDLGPPAVAWDRWLVANLAAPAIVATFANSPTAEVVAGRSLAWKRLDPTRTGVAGNLAAGEDDPVQHLLWDALRADVLIAQRGEEVVVGRPGFTFGQWVREGHPRLGHPTIDDLDRHMTTLFSEVVLRGYMEVRGVDQLPRRWRAAPAVLITGLVYDRQATQEALELLEPRRRDLPRLQDRAARRGLTDPLVGPQAVALWEIALAGARRLGADWSGQKWLDETDEFLARFTRRRRHPGDEQREMRRRGSAALLEWAR